MNSQQRERTRMLNDALRQGRGDGRLQVTCGVVDLGPDRMRLALEAVAGFTRFDEGNDPYGEHDFGAFEVAGCQLFWKIDYYDANLEAGSPDPADEGATTRVLTVMLASEY